MKSYEYIEADDYYDMAVGWLKNKSYEKAIDYLNKTIELNKHFIYAYITLAYALATQKQYSQAVHVIKRASKIDPAFDRLNFLMAKYAYKGGDYLTSLAQINRAIDIEEKPLYVQARKIIIERMRMNRQRK